MKKVLLIQPGKAPGTIGSEDVFLFEPLALEYLASSIIPDHVVMIADLRIESSLKTIFDEFRPDIAGITSYTVNVNSVKAMFREIKEWDRNVITVVGGHHATVAYEDFIEPYIDLIVTGEGVFVFKEIVKRIDENSGFDGIDGIVFRLNGKIIRTPARPIDDLDIFPFPARVLTAKYRKQYFSEWNVPMASLRTSQGCPFRCSFCALWKLNGGRYLTRSPENIVRELSGIKEESVFFADDESLIDTKRMSELADLIRESGIRKKYFMYGRSDTIVRHPWLIEKWKGIGLERIFIGLEFFRDEDLKEVGKRSSVSDNENAVRILHDLKIKVFGSFIVKPEFTRKDFREFKDYARKLRLDFAALSILTPLPGTDYYEETKEKFITRNFDHFDLLHAVLKTSLPLNDFYKEFFNLYRKMISPVQWFKILIKYPPHEILKVIKMANRIRHAQS
jgi:radical SAM superfamily enzyme YgiQ (UPF0313 family)